MRMSAKNQPKNDAEPLAFEAVLERLAAIVGSLENGKTTLAESLTSYEEGVTLLRMCQGRLDAAQRRIELLTGVDADGRPITAPFDASSTMENRRRRESGEGESESQHSPASSQPASPSEKPGEKRPKKEGTPRVVRSKLTSDTAPVGEIPPTNDGSPRGRNDARKPTKGRGQGDNGGAVSEEDEEDGLDSPRLLF